MFVAVSKWGICAHFVASKRGENEVLINGVD